MRHDPKDLLNLWVEESISLNNYENAIKQTDNPNVTPMLEDCAQSHQQRQAFLQAKLGAGKVDAEDFRESREKAATNDLVDSEDESAVVRSLFQDELQRLERYRELRNKGFNNETAIIEKLLLPEQERVVHVLHNCSVMLNL